ncbi:hypothetical protein [Thermococcus pacificus]|uniref:Uncharacterized protein n=1 Tax=Thermococcus pacificus TaxID=71998 RepID=A0A218P503_9EURY|nr:hypothetical protein [Thermococcus pacificus]ASJ05866.1 hypothetical protein A3L08_00205 [Thermococcus pacificus]
MRPKPAIVSFFLLLSLFFYGIGLLGGDLSDIAGYGVIGTIHLIFAASIYRGHETIVDISPYIALLDMLFGLLWIMVGLSLPAFTLTLLSALILVALMDEDVRTELKMGG